jgi:hypothetical protein
MIGEARLKRETTGPMASSGKKKAELRGCVWRSTQRLLS